MKSVVNNLRYIDVIEINSNTVSFLKASIKKVRLTNRAVYLELIDDIPYFLGFSTIENPATPNVAYVNPELLYTDLLNYLYIS